MKKLHLLATLALAVASIAPVSAQRQLTVQANKPGAVIQPTMYGIFFEDINFGADGGLYAEMVENRSFEFPDRLMGWNVFGNVQMSNVRPAFERNPNYVILGDSGHIEKRTGLENRGFFGMGFKKGLRYDFSVYARLHDAGTRPARIRVELVNANNNIVTRQRITIGTSEWKKYTCSLTPNVTEPKGLMRIFLETPEGVDLDHVSLFPSDNWNGLRADLVKDLEDLKPGIFRFPGGCIVEGTTWRPATNGKTPSDRWKTDRSTRTVGTTPSPTACTPTISSPTAWDSMSSSSSPRKSVPNRFPW